MIEPAGSLRPDRKRLVSAAWANKAFFAVCFALVLTLGGVSLLQAAALLRARSAPVDFGTFYLAGRMVSKEPAAIYDSTAMQNYLTLASQDASQAAYLPPKWAPPYVYPPVFAVMMRALAQQPFSAAAQIWAGLNILWLVLSIPLLSYIFGWQNERLHGARWLLLGFTALLFFPPANEVILLGQVSIILLFLTAAAMALLHHAGAWQDFLAGVLLGLAVAIKIVPVVLLGYLLLRRRWIAVAGGAAAFLAALMVGAVGIGGGHAGWVLTWSYFTHYLPATYSLRFEYPLTDNQALTTLFIRFLGDNSIPRLLGYAAEGLVACATAIIFFRRRPSTQKQITLLPEIALFSLLPMLLISWVPSNYFVMALPALAVVAGSAAWRHSWSTSPRVKLCFAAYLLMSISSFGGGSHMLIFYLVPFGLAAILILWGMLAALFYYQLNHFVWPACPEL